MLLTMRQVYCRSCPLPPYTYIIFFPVFLTRCHPPMSGYRMPDHFLKNSHDRINQGEPLFRRIQSCPLFFDISLHDSFNTIKFGNRVPETGGQVQEGIHDDTINNSACPSAGECGKIMQHVPPAPGLEIASSGPCPIFCGQSSSSISPARILLIE